MNYADSVASQVWKTGGATWTTDGSEVPNFGFMVSIKDHEFLTDVYSFGPDVVQGFTEARRGDGRYIGCWVDGTDVYLDVSLWFASEGEALMVADIENQLAVYDLYEGQTVTCKELVS